MVLKETKIINFAVGWRWEEKKLEDFENIARWRKVYYDYSLSEDSFISDIEEPLRLSEEEKPNKKIKEAMEKSPSSSLQIR